MQTVSFINMADGTKEDYEFLHQQEQPFIDSLPDRIIECVAATGRFFRWLQSQSSGTLVAIGDPRVS